MKEGLSSHKNSEFQSLEGSRRLCKGIYLFCDLWVTVMAAAKEARGFSFTDQQ